MIRRFCGFPVYRDTSVKKILGNERVEGIELLRKKSGEHFLMDCDTVVVTGKFRPDSSLIENTPIEQDTETCGPVVDMDFKTSVPNIYAAGNVLRGADMHDLCALEGRSAARSIIKKLDSNDAGTETSISMKVESPVRYVVPQKLDQERMLKSPHRKLFQGPAVQVEKTLKNGIMEAWSGMEKIWERRFRKLIANNRYPLPVEKFDWNRVDPRDGVLIRITF